MSRTQSPEPKARSLIQRLVPLVVLLCASAVNCFSLDREAFTFTNYDLEVRIEPEQSRLGARGKITLRNDSDSPQKNLSLQISSTLDWRSIRLDGKPLQFVTQPYTSDIDHTGALSEAIVTLPAPVAPKVTVELEIGYEGTVPLNATRLTRIGVPMDIAKRSDWDEVGPDGGAVRGMGHVAWYPASSDSANFSEGNSLFDVVERWTDREMDASMRINLCWLAGHPMVALMNDSGTEAATTAEGRSGETCSEHRFQPLGNTVPTFALANYEILDRPAMTIYYLAGHKSLADDYVLAGELALPFVTDWFGTPKTKARIAELNGAADAAFESGSVLFTPLNAGADTRLSQLVAVHQLTHATFPSPRPWIYEGLAHFAQVVYREQQSGRPGALEFLQQHAAGLADVEKETGGQKGTDQSLVKTAREEFYRSKAMYVWWMLRDLIGDEALKKSFASYRADHDTEPSYMQRLIALQTKHDLEWFFDDWVYRDRGLPDFRVESAFVRPTVGGGSVVTVIVENAGEAGAEVPVILHTAGGDVTRRLEVRAKSKNSVRIDAPATPLDVRVNDGSVPESDVTNNAFTIEGLNH